MTKIFTEQNFPSRRSLATVRKWVAKVCLNEGLERQSPHSGLRT